MKKMATKVFSTIGAVVVTGIVTTGLLGKNLLINSVKMVGDVLRDTTADLNKVSEKLKEQE